MDRRGPGASGDAPGYAIADEAADVAAVVDAVTTATGGTVDVLGHSYGATCALEATLQTTGIRRLVLYESGVGVPTPAGITDRLAALLDRGRREEVVTTLLRELAGIRPSRWNARCRYPRGPAGSRPPTPWSASCARTTRTGSIPGGSPPDRPDDSGKRGYVWHCSARLAAGDRTLSDGEWAGIVRELLDGAGVAALDDPGGPRWFAVRHADDHIHIAVVLVRQDTCRRFWPYRDYPRLRETARAIERCLGLTLTAAADGTAARSPSRGEIEKAARQGREPARVELARTVREAAVASSGAEAFIQALCAAGYLAELRRAPSGDPIGFKVARPGDLSAAGQPVFYSGSKLAADLSMPKLLQRWADRAGRSATVFPAAASRQVARARRAVAAARRGVAVEDADEIGHATGDVLVALRRWPGAGRDLGEAADLFDRANLRPPDLLSLVRGP